MTIPSYNKASVLGLSFTCTIYICVSLISIFLFEGGLESSVLINIGRVTNENGNPYWESTVIQITFLTVLLCHIPFIFFAGKESLCIIVDELNRSSISDVLDKKMDMNAALKTSRQTDLSNSEEHESPEPRNPLRES